MIVNMAHNIQVSLFEMRSSMHYIFNKVIGHSDALLAMLEIIFEQWFDYNLLPLTDYSRPDILDGYDTAAKGNHTFSAQLDAVADMKFTYVISCQSFGSQKASGDPHADDIIDLMKKYSFTQKRNDCRSIQSVYVIYKIRSHITQNMHLLLEGIHLSVLLMLRRKKRLFQENPERFILHCWLKLPMVMNR